LQVAYSVILQQFRHSRVVPIAAVADIAALEAAADEPSPEDAAIARDELQRVEMAIDALPRQTRTAFILRRVEGLSQQAIALQMGLSEHTIEKHHPGCPLRTSRVGPGQVAVSPQCRRRHVALHLRLKLSHSRIARMS
jgi:RNA polymerase sigma factor (sigma-70 family)